MKSKTIFIRILTVVMLIAITALHAGSRESSDNVKALMEASGITSGDISSSEGRKELNLFNVFAMAVGHSNRLIIKKEDINRSEAKKDQAFGAFLPRIYARGQIIYPENNTYTGVKTGLSLNLRQPIMTGLDEISAYKGYKSEILMKKYDLLHSINLLLSDVSGYFYRASSIETDLKSKRHVLSLYSNVLRELERRVALGRSRRSEVLRINSEIYSLQSAIKSSENDLASAMLNLSSLTGIPVNAGLLNSHTFPDPDDPEKNITSIIENRWDVKSAREAVKVAETRLLAAKGLHLPSLYLEGAYMLYTKDKKDRDYYGSIGIDIPIFSGGMVMARIREEESSKKQADVNLAETLRNARNNITDAFQTWKNSREEVEAFRLAHASSENNYNVVLNEFRLNLVTIIDLFNSLTILQNAKQNYENTLLRFSYNRVRVSIEVNGITGKKIGLFRDSMPAESEKKAR